MNNNSKNKSNNFNSLARNHYENFPVASFLIPHYYRNDVAIVYWFARTADDLADEGKVDSAKRLNELNNFENEFKKSLIGESSNQYFNQLSNTISEKKLSVKYFFDLLSAFRQDVVKKEYEDFNEVEIYCSRSANPVGRVLLELFNINEKEAIISSDKICTALQLTNFFQDTVIDMEKGRNYYPQNELKIFEVTQKMFELKENNPNIKALVKHNIERAQSLFSEGKNLLKYLNGSFRIEIKWTIAGGEEILNKIKKNDYDVFTKRPKLNKIDFISLFIKSIF